MTLATTLKCCMSLLNTNSGTLLVPFLVHLLSLAIQFRENIVLTQISATVLIKFFAPQVWRLIQACTYSRAGRYKAVLEIRKKSLITHEFRSQINTRNTRQSNHLNILRCRLATGQRSFSYRGAKLWNNLSNDLKNVNSVKAFKSKFT